MTTRDFAFGDIEALATREHQGDPKPPEAVRRGPRAVSPAGPDGGFNRAFNHLCHVLPLTKAGKVRAVLDGLVMTVLVLEDGPLVDARAVRDAIDGWFGIRVEIDEVQKSIDGHMAGGRVLRNPGTRRLGPSAIARAEAVEAVERDRALEVSVKAEWTAELAQAGYTQTQIDELWDCLRAYMARAFRQHGAMAAQLLDPTLPASTEDSMNLAVSLDAAIKETGPTVESSAVQAAVSGFFARPTVERTRYVSHLLDGTFTFFAITANEVTSVYVRGKLAALKLFLDTNFIFGLLDLHENPLSDVSKELIQLIKDQGFPYTLYFHERTLKEIQHTLDLGAERLRAWRWSPALSRAACKTQRVSGIELAYHRMNSESPTDVDVFLSKFDHIEEILRALGIRIYRTPQSRESSVEEKGRLIAEYLSYVERYRPNRPRPYEVADHDIVVWQELQHLRKRGKTALEVGALLLSTDVMFSQFDWNKLRPSNRDVTTVVLPGQILQVLRPFARGSEDFDRRFVQAFALPEFRAAHSDYADVATKVLSYISVYKDMGEETAVRLLANDLLMRQLKGVDEGTPEFADLIESALANDNGMLIEEAESAREEAERHRLEKEEVLGAAERILAEKDAQISDITEQADVALATALSQEQARADARVEEIRQEESQLRLKAEQDAAALRDQLAERDGADARRRRRWRWSIAASVWVVGSVLIIVVPHLVGWHWLLHHDHLAGIYAGSLLALGGLAVAWAAPEHRKGALAGIVIGAVLAVIPNL
jgi:hypothetical protein